MSLGNEVVEEWFVCFKDVGRKHWVQKFLKTGYQHCYAFKTSPGGQFLVIAEPMRSHLDIDIVQLNDDNLNKLLDCTEYVQVVVSYDLTKDRGHFCRFNCVEVVKSLIGLKSFWTFTPYQLYKRLIK